MNKLLHSVNKIVSSKEEDGMEPTTIVLACRLSWMDEIVGTKVLPSGAATYSECVANAMGFVAEFEGELVIAVDRDYMLDYDLFGLVEAVNSNNNPNTNITMIIEDIY